MRSRLRELAEARDMLRKIDRSSSTCSFRLLSLTSATVVSLQVQTASFLISIVPLSGA